MAGTGSIIAGAAFVKLTMDSAELKAGLDAAQGRLKQFVGQVNKFASQMSMLGPIMALPMLTAAKAFADFDDKMRLTAAVTGATGKQFQALTELAKKLGRETSYTAAQVAEGMTALGRMGFSPKEIENAINPMMNLAKATGTDLAGAAEIAANNLRVFKMETGKSSEVADILTVAANGSAQTLTDLGEALKMAGPHAARAGATLKETAGMLGVLANMGIRGSLAGTALGKSFKRMADPKVSDFLKQYGIETKNAVGDLRNMRDILVDVAKAMKNMKTGEQINFAEEVFDARGSLGGGTLSVNTEAIDEMMKKLENCNGVAQKTSDQMEAGLGGAMRRLASAAEGVSLAFGEILATTFGPVIESVSALCLGLREVIGTNSTILQGVLAVTGAFVGFGVAIKIATMVAGAIKSIFTPLLLLDKLVSGAAAKAAAAAKAEQIKQAAAAVTAAKKIADEKLITANELAEIAKRTAADAKAAAAKVAGTQLAIDADARKIAAIKAAIATRKAEAAVSGESSAAYVLGCKAEIAAINAKKVGLTQQIATEKAAAALAGKSSLAAAKAAGVAAAESSKAAAALDATSKAQAALSATTATGSTATKGYIAVTAACAKEHLFLIGVSKMRISEIAALSTAEVAAAMKTAGCSKIRIMMWYAESTACKVATAAAAGFHAICSALAKHPVIAAFAAIAVAIWAISAAAKSASENIRAQAEESQKAAAAATKLREQGDEKRQGAQVDFKRLQQLEEVSKRGKLSAEEIAEAEKLINSLDPYGSSNWASLDKISGQLQVAADAQKQFNDQMREAAQIELQSEIIKQQKAITDLQAVLDDINDEGSLLGMWTDAGVRDKDKRFDEKLEEMKAEQLKLSALQKRFDALKSGNQNAATGAKETATTADAVKAEEAKKKASVEELANAENDMARIDEDNAKKKMSQLQSEIYEIDKLKKKYMELADLKMKALEADLKAAETRIQENKKGENPAQVAAFNAAKESADKARAEIAALKQRTADATDAFDQQRTDAEKKDVTAREKAESKYTGFIGETDKKQQERESGKAQEREFNGLLKNSSTDAGRAALDQFMAGLSGSIEAARQEYMNKLQQYQGAAREGGAGLSEAEKSGLDAIQQEINAGMSRMNSYRDRIGEGQQQAQEQTKTLAAFDASALTSLFGADGTARMTSEERIAKATEDTAKYTKETAKNITGSNILIG